MSTKLINLEELAKHDQSCQWKPNNDPCQGEVRILDLFPGAKEQGEHNGFSVHAMPICEAHARDHLNVLTACGKGQEEEVFKDSERKHLNEFDTDLS